MVRILKSSLVISSNFIICEKIYSDIQKRLNAFNSDGLWYTKYMSNQQEKYADILNECEKDPDVLGLFLGGSRGKDKSFVTSDSDMDVYVIVSDDASEKLKEKILSYGSDDFEIWVHTLSQFSVYAAWGGDRQWERYNFSHNKAVIDKTGNIQKMMDEKGIMPMEVQKTVIEDALDSYINQVYRSAKYYRDGNNLSAYLDATESLPLLMTALYALEGRMKPYNKYFEWELENYPLKFLPWTPKEFIADYKHILETGDLTTQKKVYKKVKKLFIEQGFNKIIDDWKGKYFVGE